MELRLLPMAGSTVRPSLFERLLRGALDRMPEWRRQVTLQVAKEYVSREFRLSQGFMSTEDTLQTLKAAGFRPATFIDAGAAIGEWSQMARRIFPEASVVMVDANPENEETLRRISTEFGADSRLFLCLLGSKQQEEVPLYQLGHGTSIFKELSGFGDLAKPIRMPMYTLDTLVPPDTVAGPVLLKLDVQGYELEVLRGARQLLPAVEVIQAEVATLPYNQGAPLLPEVVEFLSAAGFAVYDFGGGFRRCSDSALFQIDMFFVRHESSLREKRKFWPTEP